MKVYNILTTIVVKVAVEKLQIFVKKIFKHRDKYVGVMKRRLLKMTELKMHNIINLTILDTQQH